MSAQEPAEFTTPTVAPAIANLVGLFGLSAEPLHRLMYNTGAILAGGAVTNLFYNHIHTAQHTPLHPAADLDFWIADPTPTDTHARRVYSSLITDLWDDYLHNHGFVSYCPDSGTDGTYDEAEAVQERNTFLTECGTRIRVNYYMREGPENTPYGRIQVIFYEVPSTTLEPADELVRSFDLSICQSMVYASRVNRLWVCRSYGYTDIQEHRIQVRSNNPSQRTLNRLQKYLTRYPAFHSTLIPAGAGVGACVTSAATSN